MGKGEVGERLREKKWSGGKGAVGKSDVGKCGKVLGRKGSVGER